MSEPSFARRTFLTTAAAGVAAAAMGAPRPLPAARARASGGVAPRDAGAVRLGVASYSLRTMPRDRAIAAVRALGTRYVNVKSVHADYALSPAELAAARREFGAAGLEVVGGGTITFAEDTDAGVERYFAYARAAGMPLIVATGAPAVLPRVERFASGTTSGWPSTTTAPRTRTTRRPATRSRWCAAWTAAWACASTSATPRARATTWCRRSPTPGRACSTCTSRTSAT
jgi:hypothetical protein